MWQPFVEKDCNYLIKCIHKERIGITVYLTDFKIMWSENISDDNLLSRFKNFNPLISTKSLTINNAVEKVVRLINDVSSETKISISKSDEQIDLQLKRKLKDVNVSIQYTFNLSLGDSDMFFNEFSLPLIQSVQHLEVKQKKLIKLLQEKDREIQEHELGGSELSRKSLITKTFDAKAATELVPEQLLINVFAKSKPFLEAFVQKHGALFTIAQKVDANESNPKKKQKVEVNTS